MIIPSSAANGKLGVFTIGMGAVASTLFAGVKLAVDGQRPPIGSLTQLGLMPGQDGRDVRLCEAMGLPALGALEFGGVDLIETDARTAAKVAGVLTPEDQAATADYLGSIAAEPGIYDPVYVRNLKATRVRPEKNKAEQAAAMSDVYRKFFTSRGCARGVVIQMQSTEAWRPLGAVHATPEAFRAGLKANDPTITPAQIYAWAAVDAGYALANGTPNPVLEMPALQALAEERGVPMAGSDFKSGQTFMKTVVAAGIAQRLLGVRGWYSTNILGNRDGLVLNEPENFRAKEITKGGVLNDLLDARTHPELYGKLEHQIHINYFPPKGDNKESWDAIQLFGWLGYEMELKINFQCRDSILAAPLALDIVLLLDLAARQGERGAQSWMGAFFKNPIVRSGEKVTNDLRLQMKNVYEKLGQFAGAQKGAARTR